MTCRSLDLTGPLDDYLCAVSLRKPPVFARLLALGGRLAIARKR
jgi:hypothetical protein